MNSTRSKVAMAIVIVLGTVCSLTSGFAYQVKYHIGKLSFYIANEDAESARKEIENLKYFQGLSRRWYFERLANHYLFQEFSLYEPAYYYLIGDYNRVIELLKYNDHYQASHMVGSAKFRQAKDEYATATTGRKKELVRSVLEEINPHFKKAVENSPEFKFPDPNFDDRFNYDITSDEKSAQRALEAKMPGKKVILGIPREDKGQKKSKSPNGKKPKGEKSLNEETKPGLGGNPKKKG